MASPRHEIPTHLNGEDKLFAGLAVRQIMFLTVGGASGYGLWNQWPEFILAGRVGLALLGFGLGAALAFVRPHGRGREEWAFIAGHFAALPRVSAWRVRGFDRFTGAASQRTPPWIERASHLIWPERPR